MNELFMLMITTLSLAAFFSVAVVCVRKQSHGADPVFSNIAEGTHEDGLITRTLDSAITTKHLLGKRGDSAGDIDICGASEMPIGIITDEGDAGDNTAVQLLGCAGGTVKMVASGTIVAGEVVYTAAAGKVQDLPTDAGTYYHVGVAVTAASDGEEFEAVPIQATASTTVS